VTSRFPLVDLEGWTGAGHRAVMLDDLELPVALDVLRAWGVKGDDAALARAIGPLNIGGFYHALSVAVLGSYLGTFGGHEFSLADAEESGDHKARKLHRILEQYAKALTPAERDLLARLSLFPRGVKVELLGWIVQSGGEVAGALIGLADRDLVRLLERLKALGLVFGYKTDGQIAYSAHPFLREFFRNLLGTNPESVHESVRAKLAPSLEARPSAKPRDAAVLDQYELLIEETLLAGRVQEAFDLYWDGLGSFDNLAKVLGESGRGLRILRRFAPLGPDLRLLDRFRLLNDLALLAANLGDLAAARAALDDAVLRVAWFTPFGVLSLTHVELFAGHLAQSMERLEIAIGIATNAEDNTLVGNSLAYRATARFLLGDVSAAAADFRRATELEREDLFSLRGVQEAECKVLLGDLGGALSQTHANREFAVENNWNEDLCRCNALLARLLAPADSARAAQHLHDARAFANRSGDVELQLRCFHAACELQRHLGDYPQSIVEGEAGILLADTCGFGKYSIDLRLALAETYLAAGDARQALQNARNALDRSEEPDCQYAWGKADGLHCCGIAHLRLGERELARQRLTAALEIRERLGHGRIEETRAALAGLKPRAG